ncbi:MAG: amidohydrolase, partial [candidate division Zixibacteria bacterium]|nr:amidohydrolase [candidate division Zixibacteria bacterium]
MSLLTKISTRRNSALMTLIFGCLSTSLIPVGAVAENSTTPEYGIRDKTPSLRAFTNARIVVSPDLTYEKGSLVIDNGKIVSVGKNISVPKAARIVDLSGKTIYAAFIDPYAEYGFEKAKKQKRDRNSKPKYTGDRVGGNSWNDAIHSQRNWSEEFKPDKKSAKDFIEQGFAIVQSVRKDGVFRGRGVTASLGKGLPNDL